jgi:hypothetical protein
MEMLLTGGSYKRNSLCERRVVIQPGKPLAEMLPIAIDKGKQLLGVRIFDETEFCGEIAGE